MKRINLSLAILLCIILCVKKEGGALSANAPRLREVSWRGEIDEDGRCTRARPW